MFLKDSHNRSFSYLRLSVTEKCNFKCEYCLPNGYEAKQESSELSVTEIVRVVRAFAKLGLKKIRLTGGEPTVRNDLLDIVHEISKIEGIERIALTTNGYKLSELAFPLRAAGVSHLNISLDSLTEERFNKIVNGNKFEKVMSGIQKALDAKFPILKLNVVLMNDTTDEEINKFIDFIKNKPISVRFIELMRTEKNKNYFEQKHISAGDLRLNLLKNNWVVANKSTTDGPAIEFKNPHSIGTIGIIAPYSEGFCRDCNRLRVTSQGGLRLCLFGEQDFSLRKYLYNNEQLDDLTGYIKKIINEKPESHYLKLGKFGNNSNFSQMGG